MEQEEILNKRTQMLIALLMVANDYDLYNEITSKYEEIVAGKTVHSKYKEYVNRKKIEMNIADEETKKITLAASVINNAIAVGILDEFICKLKELREKNVIKTHHK